LKEIVLNSIFKFNKRVKIYKIKVKIEIIQILLILSQVKIKFLVQDIPKIINKKENLVYLYLIKLIIWYDDQNKIYLLIINSNQILNTIYLLKYSYFYF
jgi:hypothetical protein